MRMYASKSSQRQTSSNETMARLDLELGELRKALTGISYLGELTPRSQDYVLSFGERLSTLVLAAALHDSGVETERLTGEEAGIVTDASFGEATPLMHVTQQKLKDKLSTAPQEPKDPGRHRVHRSYAGRSPNNSWKRRVRLHGDADWCITGSRRSVDMDRCRRNNDGGPKDRTRCTDH